MMSADAAWGTYVRVKGVHKNTGQDHSMCTSMTGHDLKFSPASENCALPERSCSNSGKRGPGERQEPPPVGDLKK